MLKYYVVTLCLCGELNARSALTDINRCSNVKRSFKTIYSPFH
jgi:hypothetical protein